MAPAALYQFQDLFFSVILHIASQLTHRIRSGFAPAHRTGTHPVGIHMTHMTFCTASIHILILHSSHCASPVVQQVFLTVIHCFFVRCTFPDSFYSLYKLFLLALIQGLPQPSFSIYSAPALIHAPPSPLIYTTFRYRLS